MYFAAAALIAGAYYFVGSTPDFVKWESTWIFPELAPYLKHINFAITFMLVYVIAAADGEADSSDENEGDNSPTENWNPDRFAEAISKRLIDRNIEPSLVAKLLERINRMDVDGAKDKMNSVRQLLVNSKFMLEADMSELTEKINNFNDTLEAIENLGDLDDVDEKVGQIRDVVVALKELKST